jgi:hypothetical protein
MEGRMLFNFSRMTEVVGAWLLAFADKDWLGMIFKEVAIGPWILRYRTRYYDPEDPDPWSGLDRRTWEEVHLAADLPRDELLALMRGTVAQIREAWPQPMVGTDEVLVHGDGQALARALSTRPWAQRKSGPEAEAWARAYAAQQLPAQRRRATRAKGRRQARRG